MRVLKLIFFCGLLLIINVQNVQSVDFINHNYTAIETILKNYSSFNHSKIQTTLYSIGNSHAGKELLVLEITASPNRSGIPNVKLIGGMFGNEPEGSEILLHFIDYLITSYGKDENVTYLLDNTKIHVLPLMNPDGRASNTKGNLRNIPLNNLFPELYRENKMPQQPESEAIIGWMKSTFFVLSATLNGKGKVVIYPYTTKKYYVKTSKVASLTPDSDVFEFLATTYSRNHPTMVNAIETECVHIYRLRKLPIKDGILNGALFEEQDGTMQDYNYFKHGCMELNIRVGCDTKPSPAANPSNFLKSLWKENRNALIRYSLMANQGVYGVVRDFSTNKSVQASFKVIGRDINVNTNKNGEFWKVLLRGKYTIEVTAKGYYQKNETFEITMHESFPKLKHLIIYLTNSTIPTTTINTPMETKMQTGNLENSTEFEVLAPRVGTVISSAALHKKLSCLLLLCFSVYLVIV